MKAALCIVGDKEARMLGPPKMWKTRGRVIFSVWTRQIQIRTMGLNLIRVLYLVVMVDIGLGGGVSGMIIA